MVLDTNVLVHASNTPPDLNKIYDKNSVYYHWCDASRFIDTFIREVREKGKKIAICVDGIWDITDQGKNKSQIVFEYWEHVLRGSPEKLGKILLVTLAKNGLILTKPKWPNQRDKHFIERIIHSNKTDRIFVGVTCSTNKKTMISNDENDFPDKIRKVLRSQIKIDIHRSDEQEIINRKYFS